MKPKFFFLVVFGILIGPKVFAQQAKYVVTIDSLLSSSSSEFAPRFTDNSCQTMIFTSDRGNSRHWQNIFFSSLQDNKWTTPVPVIKGEHNDCNYGVVSMDTKRKMLFFTRCDMQKGVSRKCRICYSFMQGDLIGEQFPLDLDMNKDTVGNEAYTFGHPYFSNQSNVLLFVSDMPGGFGSYDIWYSKYDTTTDSWGRAQNAGPNINTDKGEFYPFLGDDGTLYFTSDGHGGFGGWDIFKADRTGEMKWGNAENMGEPINSDSDDFGIVVKANAQSGYFSSKRRGGKGGDDIYSFSPVKNNQSENKDYLPITKDTLANETKRALTVIFNQQACNTWIDSLSITNAKAYPNPNRGEFTFEFESNKSINLSLRIYSSLGKVVYAEQVSVAKGKYDKQYNLQNYSKGIYYIQLLYGCESIKTVKVLID